MARLCEAQLILAILIDAKYCVKQLSNYPRFGHFYNNLIING